MCSNVASDSIIFKSFLSPEKRMCDKKFLLLICSVFITRQSDIDNQNVVKLHFASDPLLSTFVSGIDRSASVCKFWFLPSYLLLFQSLSRFILVCTCFQSLYVSQPVHLLQQSLLPLLFKRQIEVELIFYPTHLFQHTFFSRLKNRGRRHFIEFLTKMKTSSNL